MIQGLTTAFQDPSVAPTDHRTCITWTALGIVVATVVFLSVPEIDLIVSSWFFAEDGFARGGHTRAQIIRDIFQVLFIGLCATILVAAIVREVAGITLFRLTRREIWYLIVSISTGPGLLVNTIFKDHWGRARPVRIEEFGGDRMFSPVWIITDQCGSNCSFMSGEAAAGFSIIAFALIATKFRVLAFLVALTLGVMMMLVRIAMGAHFFSDTVLSALTVFLICLVAHQFIVGGALDPVGRLLSPLFWPLRTGWRAIASTLNGQVKS